MSKTALVTGANRGIGLEVCRELGRRDHVVWLGARELERGERAASELRAEGIDARAIAVDVSSRESVRELGERRRADRWKLDALVNNAGVSLSGFDADVAAATLETNFYGAMRVTDALLDGLGAGACVVNVSSGMGELRMLGPEPRRELEQVSDRARLLELMQEFVRDVRAGRHSRRGWPSNAYSVSKAALNAFTRVLAAEQPRLRVNSVCPDWVRTSMGGSAAPRSPVEGAAGIVWAATLPPDAPSGGFFRDARRIPW